MEVNGRKVLSAKLTKNILCESCRVDGDIVQAAGFCVTCNEYFCVLCLKCHQRQSATKNHVIRTKNEMPTVRPRTDPCLELCAFHKTEIIQFFCPAHNLVGCGNCILLWHKTCEVALVQDVSGKFDSKLEVCYLKSKIEEFQKKLSSIQQEINYNFKSAEEMKSTAIKDIQDFRNDINSYLDNVEEELLTKVEKIYADDVGQHERMQKECEAMETEMKGFVMKLSQSSNKINKLFVTAKLAMERLQTCQKLAENITFKCKIDCYLFVPQEDLARITENMAPLGKLLIESKKFTTLSSNKESDRSICRKKERTCRKLNWPVRE